MNRTSRVRLVSIVDDDESVREGLKSLMRSAGFTVEAFASAEDFLSSAQRQETACLILDVRLPGMSGLELQDQSDTPRRAGGLMSGAASKAVG